MISTRLLEDLYAHMEWGDSIIWKAVSATPAATEDVEVKDRLFHIHFTQRAFMQVWKGEELERFKAEAFPTLSDLYPWIRPCYVDMKEFLMTLDDAKLALPMPVPWARYFGRQLGCEVEVTTLGETLLQVSSHSIHHRAQINVQLRAHGGEPPLIDYIAWLWSGRPAPVWD